MLLFSLAGRFCGLITGKVVRFKLFSQNHLLFFMESKAKTVYEEAVYALNGLQSNSAVLRKACEERSKNAHANLLLTERHLETLGINSKDLNNLNIIHVAGTKGKGSTCAFTESILRKHGYKTGFYSSPHLISVNERIRINGLPLDKELFAKYFWEVYRNIQCSLKDGECMPPYFMFLTVMAFYVFIKEQVQAAVVEVGIGGLYDCTNIVRKPIAVGITTLGFDHLSLLGNTITEIAAQKAGIFKPFVPAFTVPQMESAMNVLRKRAQELHCPLFLSPPIEAYEETISLSAQGIVQNVNASLALQLTNTWLEHHNKKAPKFNCDGNFRNEDISFVPLTMAPIFHINSQMQDALKSCIWLGRFQTVRKGKITFYLDGAHTHESMRNCVRWFEDQSQILKNESSVLRILLFNCTRDRKPENILDPLADIHFDIAMFCPNRINVMKDASSDLSNFMVEPETEIKQCVKNKEVWDHLMRSLYENELSMTTVNSLCVASKVNLNASVGENSLLFDSISNALNFISLDKNSIYKCDQGNANRTFFEMIKNANHIQLLVTGSLHLVGGVLSLIDT